MNENFIQKALEEHTRFMKERYKQLNGYYDHPFLKDPLALKDICPTCHINISNFMQDSNRFLKSKLKEQAEYYKADCHLNLDMALQKQKEDYETIIKLEDKEIESRAELINKLKVHL